MTELERALVALGREIEYPPTPDLARAVERRLAGAGSGAERVWAGRFALRSRRAVLIAVAVLLLMCGTVVAAVPAARDAVLELFHLRGATIERRERLPAGARPGRLELGSRTTLAAARHELAFAPLLPLALGDPDGVYTRREPSGGELTLDYRRHARLIVTEFRGDLHPDYAGKIADPATSVEPVSVGGMRALWVAGAPHFFFYRDERGRVREGTLRLAQNVLLVEHGRVLVRIEGPLGKPEALRIARSLR
jgi:hypothetical protein